MTKSLEKALKIIKDNQPIRPRRFAELMWKDSPSWSKVTNVGRNGAAHGVGMSLAGGGYLGKLAKQGLVERDYGCTDKYKIYYFKGYKLTTIGYALWLNISTHTHTTE